MTPRAPVTFGQFQLDFEVSTLWCAGREVPLQPKALELLVLLASHPNRTLTKSHLIRELWPDTIVTESSLAVAVNAVRKALGESAAHPRYVQTLPRRGYRFVLLGAPSPAVGREASPPKTFGRARELALLGRWWADSSESGQVAFVMGEAGSGKTTLVEEFVASLSAAPVPVTQITGRCLTLSGAGAPFLPFLEALRVGLNGPAGERLAACLKQCAPTWCKQFPSLSTPPSPAGEEQVGLPIFDRAQLLGELADALLACARERPLLCIIEDLHWVDPSSVDFLAVLCARPAQPGFLLLGTLRAEAVETTNAAFARLQTDLRRRRRSRELCLAGLEVEHLEQLLAARFPNNTFAGQLAPLLHQRTEGHALFATRMLELLVERGDVLREDGRWRLERPLAPLDLDAPRTVLEAIRERMDVLDEAERRTLGRASVLGNDFEVATLARLLGVDDVLLEERLRRLDVVHGILTEVNEPGASSPELVLRFRFAHVLFRESAYARLGLRERAGLHSRVAHILADGADPLDASRATELALHFERGRDFERAVAWSVRAADNAGRIHSDVEAVGHLQRGLTLLPRLDQAGGLAWGAVLHCKLGWAELHLRRGAVAKLAFEAAVGQARALGALGREPRAMAAFAAALEVLEQPHGDVFGMSAAEQLVPGARRLGAACLEAAALQGTWMVERWLSLERLPLVAEQLLALSESAKSDAIRAHGLAARAQADVVAGRLAEARANLDEALGLSRQQADAALPPLLLHTRADVALLRADFADAEADATAALGASASFGGVSRGLMQRAVARGKLGRVSEALSDFRRLEQLYERSVRANPYGYDGVWLRRELGDDTGAMQRAEAGVSAWREQFPAERWVMAALHLGWEHAAAGNGREARASLEEASHTMQAFGAMPLRVELTRRQLDVEIARQDERRGGTAVSCAERWKQLADRHGAREHQLLARLELALLSADAHPGAAAAELDEALQQLEGHRMPFIAYKLLATRAELADQLGEPGAELARTQARALIGQIAGAIDDTGLQGSFLQVARGWLRAPSRTSRRSHIH
jgi:tetratricopeptide (TPR) repeat protein